MANIFLCSDHHLHHENLLSFLDNEGKRFRLFDSIDEHDEYLIQQHNKVVKPGDKVYFLGDLVFSKKHIHLVGRMNGEKVLIKGNHDKLKLSEYQTYFKDVRGSHQFDGLILTHIPVHPSSLGRWPVCVHGHLHTNRVMLDDKIDERYQSVCMEQLDDYTPLSLEELKSRVRNLGLIL